LVIAAGAIGACEVPIRTVATSVSVMRFPEVRPQFRRRHTFTPRVYSNQVETGKTEQINEVLRSILDFLIWSI
jgi:hypothetical protein